MDGTGIRLVAFDLGGVLVRLCRTWRQACERAGVPFRGDADAEEAIRRRRAAIAEYDTGRIACAEFFRRVSEAGGGLYAPEEVERVHHAWLLGEYPGVGEIVDLLSNGAGVETGILSNTNPSHWRRVAPTDGSAPEFPTLPRIRHRHASHLMGLAKPSPEVFRRFETLAGGRRPAEILFFDDLEENVEAARRAGWSAERVDPTGDPASQMRAALRVHGVL